jgi:alkylation response protein AidB-like acyl-CoA dehydrogenase
VDFSYTTEQRTLIARVRELYEFIKPYELECEMNNGLSADAHQRIREAVLAADLQAVNMPSAWGGAALTTMDQILYHEVLGRLTNALWDTVWRPANALKVCTPEQRERYLDILTNAVIDASGGAGLCFWSSGLRVPRHGTGDNCRRLLRSGD